MTKQSTDGEAPETVREGSGPHSDLLDGKPSFQNTLLEYEHMNAMNQPVDRLLTLRQVMDIVGFRQTSIYQMIQEGTFPKQLKPMGGRSSRWSEREINGWIETHRSAR